MFDRTPQKAKQIQAVLFDLDGTLIEVQERLFLSCRQTFHQLNIDEPDENAYWEAFRAYKLDQLIPDSLRPQFFALMLDHYCAFTGEVKPISGALAALQFCQEQGYCTAVITSRRTSPEQLRAELERTGHAPFIDVIKTHEDVHISTVLAKEQRLLEAITELSATPAQSIYVGDLPDDIGSTRRAGLHMSVAVLSGGVNHEVLAMCKPDVILDSVGELPQYLTIHHRGTENTECLNNRIECERR